VDIKELRECNTERLEELEKNLRRQIFDARIKNFTNQLDDTASIRRARRDLARVKTVMSEPTAPGDTVSDTVSDAGSDPGSEETE
jgi:large subunit ribosomal protein L29